MLDVAPNTVPSPSTSAEALLTGDDLFDMPTRSDPTLRRLVEQELELHRNRKPPSK